MTTPLLPAAVGVLALLFGAGVQDAVPASATAAETAATFDADAAVDRASAYLDALNTMQGRFLQTASDGSSAEGAFYLDRPGRVRFEYDAPHPSLIVSDGATVAHKDRELDTVDRVPIGQTPLNLFLKSNVDLAKDARIVDVEQRDGELAITAEDPSGETEGRITLIFAAPSLELREWIVTDSLDQQVRVSLLDVVRGVDIDPKLFVLRDDRPRRRPR